MIFFKVIAYFLLSIGVCTVVLAGIAAIIKKYMITANAYSSKITRRSDK
ncbi:TPA: hypothetical protein QCO67_005098 [Bacillus cereus]|nr:hypothetical protein [Bacillus cereus]HDR3914379.1 hypothetical protein [Bacillus cereus]HDV7172625.1 hypothetical protein [Bacillus cereus]